VGTLPRRLADLLECGKRPGGGATKGTRGSFSDGEDERRGRVPEKG